MILFILATLLNLCCVLSSPAVRRAGSTATAVTSSTTAFPTGAFTFYWSNADNTSYGGYYPESDECPGTGTTCEEACGLGAVECGSDNMCYFPDLGDQCCFDFGCKFQGPVLRLRIILNLTFQTHVGLAQRAR